MNYDGASQKLLFKVQVRANTWFGIGFGTTMTNTDMITFSARGDNGEVIDQYSRGQ